MHPGCLGGGDDSRPVSLPCLARTGAGGQSQSVGAVGQCKVSTPTHRVAREPDTSANMSVFFSFLSLHNFSLCLAFLSSPCFLHSFTTSFTLPRFPFVTLLPFLASYLHFRTSLPSLQPLLLLPPSLPSIASFRRPQPLFPDPHSIIQTMTLLNCYLCCFKLRLASFCPADWLPTP